MKCLTLGPDVTFPLDITTQPIGILAARGAGKSNTAVVMAEEMFAAGLPFVVLDAPGAWWGLRSAADGKGPGLAVPVLGGEHGDIPLEATGGLVLADLIAETRLSCVIDLSEFSETAKARFVADFADRLYRKNRDPLHVFIEEADDLAPQKPFREQARSLRALQNLVKRGRFHGLGVTIITQRSAAVNKDLLTQISTLIAMRTTSPQDRKAILGWVDYHAASREIVDSLPSLADGEAWLISPQWLQRMDRVRFRRRTTFDSGATPVHGETRRATALADVDLNALQKQMAETIERAKADDPKELRRRIADLERQLRTAPVAEPTEVRVEVPVEVEVPVLSEDLVLRLEAALEPVAAVLAEVQDRLTWETKQSAEAIEMTRRLRPVPTVPTPVKRPAPQAPRTAPPQDGAKLGKGERTVLGVLAQWPDGRTYNELAFLAGYSAKASTLGVILANLRKKGYVEPGNQPVRLTADGLAAAGGPQELPSGSDLLAHWLGHSRMGEGERKVLQALIDFYPEAPDHESLCAETGYSAGASTMGVILSKLRKLGLVEKGRRRVPDEFMEAIRA